MASVIGELGDLEPVPTVLVLDDFHAVDESAEACDFVERLARDAPPWLSLVISSRRAPNPSARQIWRQWRAHRDDTDDLRFTHDEILALFAAIYATPLDEDVLRELDRAGQRLDRQPAALPRIHSRPAAERKSERLRAPCPARRVRSTTSWPRRSSRTSTARLEELLVRSSILASHHRRTCRGAVLRRGHAPTLEARSRVDRGGRPTWPADAVKPFDGRTTAPSAAARLPAAAPCPTG